MRGESLHLSLSGLPVDLNIITRQLAILVQGMFETPNIAKTPLYSIREFYGEN
jgi:hypothetical protein